MVKDNKRVRSATVMTLLAGLVLLTGCGTVAQLLYVIKGHKSPAAFDGLKGKRVAVVVVSDASAYGADTLTYNVAKLISIKLANNVKDIEVIPPSTIESWMDTNNWNQTDFNEIGRGINAEMVVSVEVSAYTIHDGSTLYKGQADTTVSVHNIAKGGQIEFSKGPSDYVFPSMGRPSIQTTDRKFEALYLSKLTDHISRLFYAHDRLEMVAEDAAMPF